MTASLLPVTPVSLDPATVRRERLANGLTVLVRRDATAPVVAVVTYVKAGYFDETDDVIGIAHVLEHMFFKGTAERGVGEISKQTKAAGGYLNAHTIYDHTSYYAVLPSSGFVAGLEVQADAYVNSAIEAGELAKELEVIIQEANRKTDNPGAVATETLYELLHDAHRMRRWRIGREAGLRTLDRTALVRFYRNFYRPSNTILSIVGDIDPGEAMRHVERLYGALPDGEIARVPGPDEPARSDFRYRDWSGDVAQTQLVLGWRTVPAAHDDAPRLDLAATVLGAGRASRLYRAVRERRLASSVSAYHYTPTELGVFVLHAEANADTALDAARASWAELIALREHGVTAGELERAHSIFESRWVRRLETMDGQANYLAEWEAAGGWELGDAYLAALLAATPEDVQAAVRRHLHPDAAAMIVYRPDGAPALAPDAAAMRALLDAAATGASAVNDEAEPVGGALPDESHAAGTGARLEREEAGIRVYHSATGVPILVRHKPGAGVTHLGVFMATGAAHDGETGAGLSNLAARTTIKGTTTRSARQIAEAGELLGGSVGPSVGSESVGWSISVPRKRVEQAVELLADVVLNPTFPQQAVESERAVALADIASLPDDMYRYPLRLATRAAFPEHAYGIPLLGTAASLPSLGVDELRRWHRERVLGAEAVIAIVGDVDADAVATLLSRHFAALRPGLRAELPPPVWSTKPVQATATREKKQTALALVFPGPGRRDDDRFTARIVAGIASGLGGRFFDELRDRQSLAYTVQAYPSERRQGGAFVAYIATSPAQEEQARTGLLAEFAKLRDEPVGADELALAQTYAIGTHAIAQQSGGNVLGDMVDAWLFGAGLRELDEFESRVRSVTPGGIQTLANRWFDEGRLVEGIVRGVDGATI